MIVVRRADDSMTQLFDIFSIYGPTSWLTILGSLCAYTMLGIAISWIESRYISAARVHPAYVSCERMLRALSRHATSSTLNLAPSL